MDINGIPERWGKMIMDEAQSPSQVGRQQTSVPTLNTLILNHCSLIHLSLWTGSSGRAGLGPAQACHGVGLTRGLEEDEGSWAMAVEGPAVQAREDWEGLSGGWGGPG